MPDIMHESVNVNLVLAASILEDEVTFKPSVCQLAKLFGVIAVYIWLARQFSPAKRKAIASGKDPTSFAALLSPPVPRLSLPAPVSDAQLADIICNAGIDRTIEVARAVENAATA